MNELKTIQTQLCDQINLSNIAINKGINLCAGVDVTYWREDKVEWGICCIIVINYHTGVLHEVAYSHGRVEYPYIPGFLSLRELPLVVQASKKLSSVPDLFIFDGNGYLHPRHMGIATHASFFLNKPTIGVAKNYLQIPNAHFKMPHTKAGSYENITVGDEVYGRVLRTRENVKPIFISCGNYIDLQTATEITLHLINNGSRLPIPVRLADIESRRMRRQISAGR